MAKTLAALDELSTGLLFVNLVDFDQLYGHRNDVEGYAKALEEFDAWLPSLYEKLSARDLLIITADHGCDPTTPSTDHSREYVPLLVIGRARPEASTWACAPRFPISAKPWPKTSAQKSAREPASWGRYPSSIPYATPHHGRQLEDV
jgi:hypothetical protein